MKHIDTSNDVLFTLLEFYYNTYKIDVKKKVDALNIVEVASEEFNQISPPDTEQLCIILSRDIV